MTPEEFKQIRKAKGLSCKKMAEFLGLKDRRTIQRYESGALQVPRFVVIILELTKREAKLADAYGERLEDSDNIDAWKPIKEIYNMEWQPIETAPRNGTKILVFGGYVIESGGYGACGQLSNPAIAYYSQSANRFESNYCRYFDELTHWMPLPSAPTTNQGSNHVT